MVAARKLTTPQLMFKLFCMFQTGGQAERSSLLQLLTEFKENGTLSDVRKNVDDWIEPVKAEYESLVSETKAVLP